MNQKGEVTLLGVFIIFVLTGVFLLCALELQLSYKRLQQRSHLFLCVKEAKGELHLYLKFMGRTNWAIKNIQIARLVMLVIPGLQAASFNSDKIKKLIIFMQIAERASYLKTLASLKRKSCPLDPRMFITPFQLEGLDYRRDLTDRAILRSKQWNYLFSSIDLEIKEQDLESLNPKIQYTTSEKLVKLPFLSF